MRRLGIGAIALVLMTTVAPLEIAAAGRPSGSDTFCEAAHELDGLLSQEGRIDVDRRIGVDELRDAVDALDQVAPKSLSPAFRKLLHFYDLILARKIATLDPQLRDRYHDEVEKVAPASVTIAKRVDRECGISFRG